MELRETEQLLIREVETSQAGGQNLARRFRSDLEQAYNNFRLSLKEIGRRVKEPSVAQQLQYTSRGRFIYQIGLLLS